MNDRPCLRRLLFDVLVIGSGASGLAAAVSAERAGARVGLATKTTLQACNSAKAQGGIQAAFGEDDSPEIHAEDVWRSSHETADRRLVEILTSEASSAIHWLEELGVEFTRGTAATGWRAAAARPCTVLQVSDRTGTQSRGAREAYRWAGSNPARPGRSVRRRLDDRSVGRRG
jgi:succinate dehydrogenase/fumarate reductase flavoprotein subunit